MEVSTQDQKGVLLHLKRRRSWRVTAGFKKKKKASNTSCFRGDTSVHFQHQSGDIYIPHDPMWHDQIAELQWNKSRELDEQLLTVSSFEVYAKISSAR